MTSAGRILIMPKGNYNSATTYKMLDLVNHNGKSWLAKKTSVGIEPSDANSEYWQNMFNINADNFGAIRRDGYGDYEGNVDELKQAGTYIVVTELENVSGTLPIEGDYFFTVDVIVGGTGSVIQTWYLSTSENSISRFFIRHFNGEVWSEYYDSDLDNYLKAAGGVLSGNISIRKPVPEFELVATDTRRSLFHKNATADGDAGTSIIDTSDNVETTLSIQNGKLILRKKVEGIDVGSVVIAEVTA